MYITELVSAIETKKINTLKPSIAKTMATAKTQEKKKPIPIEVITKATKELSLNIKNVLSDMINNKNLFEARNDIKIYVRATVLETPSEFKSAKITNINKQRIKAYLISKREDFKLKIVGKHIEFKKAVNEAVEAITNPRSLDNILNNSNNVKQLYVNLIEEIAAWLSVFFRPLLSPEKRNLKVNIESKVGEIVGIKLVAPNTSTVPAVEGGSYYEHEPNGGGSFPDYVFHFGKIENEDAKKIRKIFKVPQNINRISFEIKTATNIVGKQTSPEMFFKKLKNLEIFKKLTKLNVKDNVSININELISILNADGLGVDKWIVYLNPAGKTPEEQARKLKWLADFAPFKVIRNTPGQIAIVGKNGKTMFKIEVGRTAYEQGMFRTITENILSSLLKGINNVKTQ